MVRQVKLSKFVRIKSQTPFCVSGSTPYMKKATFLLFFLMLVGNVFGQIIQPGKWTFSKEDNKNGEYTLIFKLKIDPEWHAYAQSQPDGGPDKMIYTFKKSDCYQRIGKVIEPKPHIKFDSIFMIDEHSFDGEVIFKQKVKVNSNCKITGSVYAQYCKDLCVQYDTDFEFTFGDIKSEATPLDTNTLVQNPEINDTSQIVNAVITPGQLEEGCGGDGQPISNADKSLIAIFIAGLLGGFVALLTPCVFPMIPMTVSFFTKRSGSRRKGIMNAIIYALSIIIIYVSLGLFVTVTFGSDALNELSSNAFFNLSFFIIFVIFAISFFGAFEITLPSWMINKADSASDKGGLLGIFFMAFTLSLVSFSCTGPIIGTLLVEAAHGQSYLGPLVGMFGFSFALAVPFAIFALFPGWLNSLPKSGGWLNTVKVTLGFIELALAFKFLSNVDLAYHWGFLKREMFIAIWVVISLMLGLYLIGKIKLSHDSDVPYISVGRLIVSIIVFTFALYLIPGMWGAPLRLISGFPPPDFYKEWQTGKENECPHDLSCFHDYEEGMAYAKIHNKPVMVDFTGWACVNCRKMEDNVWSDPKVMKKIREEYVLISLYVDDKKALPQTEQYISTLSGKNIKTTGNKWSDFQASKYNTNSQPYYVLLDNKGNILAQPRGYTPDIQTYANFLDEGLCRYQKRQE